MRKLVRRSLLLGLFLLAQTSHAQQGDSFGIPISTTVYASFPDNSAIFRPASDDLPALMSAREAALVAIRARTSLGKFSAKDEALALARATAARAYLIARGVSPLKITLNYASAADFAADNSTPEGRMQNQRVEIDIIHVPALVAARAPTRQDAFDPPQVFEKPRTPTRAGWIVRKADQTIEGMLRRWAEDVGWRVVWKNAPKIDITKDGERPVPHAEFFDAANYVVEQLKAAGYRIKADSFDNQYLLISGE